MLVCITVAGYLLIRNSASIFCLHKNLQHVKYIAVMLFINIMLAGLNVAK